MLPAICRSLSFLLSISFLVPPVLTSVTTETLTDRSAASGIHVADTDPALAEQQEAACSGVYKALGLLEKETDTLISVFNSVNFAIHRNGEPAPCGRSPSSTMALKMAVQGSNNICDSKYPDKFQVESFLTDLFATELWPGTDTCETIDNETARAEGFYGYCDMGPDRTVIQNDHHRLVKTKNDKYPCRFYTREGRRVYSLQHFTNLAEQAVAKSAEETCTEGDETCEAAPTVHLYAVPAGRMFMFPASHVGERFVLNHIQDRVNGTIVLEVISIEPRVFEIENFFTMTEAQELIEKALADTSPTHGFHRSTTGATHGQVFSKRTSENAWDTDGRTSMRIKRRCFETLGIDEFHVSHTDGLQILRYKNGQAYSPHPDYLSEQGTENYDYDSAGKGGNRFATILLYMTDLEEEDGGSTVFMHGFPPGTQTKDILMKHQAIERFREQGGSPTVQEGSWEEEMAAMCRARLAIQPRKGRAVLFYSQYPNGEHDHSALHGGCPVLNGTKWAANLWVWSAPRPEYDRAPRKYEETEEERVADAQPVETVPSSARYATFTNTGRNPKMRHAKLYYEDMLFGDLAFGGQPIAVNTYEGHEWDIQVSGEVVKSFRITGEKTQNFEI